MRNRVLVVSEDPAFITRVRDRLRPWGATVVACMGPAGAECFLDTTGSCPLTRDAPLALVDTPRGGAFRYHLVNIPAAEYAERLQRLDPETHVVLIGGELGDEPSEEVATVGSEAEALTVSVLVMRAAEYEGSTDPEGGAT